MSKFSWMEIIIQSEVPTTSERTMNSIVRKQQERVHFSFQLKKKKIAKVTAFNFQEPIF